MTLVKIVRRSLLKIIAIGIGTTARGIYSKGERLGSVVNRTRKCSKRNIRVKRGFLNWPSQVPGEDRPGWSRHDLGDRGGWETQSDKEGDQIWRAELSVYINLAGLLQKLGNARQIWRCKSWGLVRKSIQRKLTKVWSRRDCLSDWRRSQRKWIFLPLQIQ